jgi:predicted DNA-binding protein (UPF0251 family)
LKLCEFVKPEIDHYLEECNFTKEEETLFLMRTKDVTFEKCAEIMNISVSTAYRINRKIQNKMRVVYESSMEQRKVQNIPCRR